MSAFGSADACPDWLQRASRTARALACFLRLGGTRPLEILITRVSPADIVLGDARVALGTLKSPEGLLSRVELRRRGRLHQRDAVGDRHKRELVTARMIWQSYRLRSS